jgi:hypothetical protein
MGSTASREACHRPASDGRAVQTSAAGSNHEAAPDVVKEIMDMQHASKCQLFMVVLDLQDEVMWTASTRGCILALAPSTASLYSLNQQPAGPFYMLIRNAIFPGPIGRPGLGEVRRSCSTCPTEWVNRSAATTFGIRWKRVQQRVQGLPTERWRVAVLAQQGPNPPQELVDVASRIGLQHEPLWLQLRLAICKYRDAMQPPAQGRPPESISGVWLFW